MPTDNNDMHDGWDEDEDEHIVKSKETQPECERTIEGYSSMKKKQPTNQNIYT